MNIFAYAPCPRQSAMWLDDIRKNKMITESCQLLSDAVHLYMPDMSHRVFKQLPKQYELHPCNIWTRTSHANFCWLLQHAQHMYVQRGLPHKSARIFPALREFRDAASGLFPEKILTPFANSAANKELGLSFKHISNTHAAYRLYSRERWRLDTIKLTWKYGEEPHWRQ